MYYDKKKYENLIEESPLFSIDKYEEVSAYKRESYKMIEYIYCYLMAVNEKEFEPYACEIMEVSTRCIGNFDKSKGNFLHYFNSAWKQEYSHVIGNQIIDKKLRGIRVTEEEKRNIYKYIKLAERKEYSCSQSELMQNIATAMQIPVEKVILIAKLSKLNVSGDNIRNGEGEEISAWDQISDGVSIEDDLLSADSLDDLFKRIEDAFASLQARQKPIISDIITTKIWPLVSEKQIEAYSFLNKEIVDICQQGKQMPTQRTIANKYGRDEASISRTFKEFVKKLQIILREV